MQQTGLQICAEICQQRTLRGWKASQKLLRGERIPHADPTLQSGSLLQQMLATVYDGDAQLPKEKQHPLELSAG